MSKDLFFFSSGVVIWAYCYLFWNYILNVLYLTVWVVYKKPIRSVGAWNYSKHATSRFYNIAALWPSICILALCLSRSNSMKENRPYMNWKGKWKRKTESCMPSKLIKKRSINMFILLLYKLYISFKIKYDV